MSYMLNVLPLQAGKFLFSPTSSSFLVLDSCHKCAYPALSLFFLLTDLLSLSVITREEPELKHLMKC